MGLTRDYLKFVPNGVCNVVGSPDGVVKAIDDVTCAVSACENVYFFNMRTLEKSFQISKPEQIVTVFALNAERSIVAVGYDSGEVHLHFKEKSRDVSILTGHRTGVNCLAFSDDGLMLASGGKDSVIVVWDVVNETGLFRLNGHKGSVTQMQFTRGSKHLVSSSKDFQVKFWNLASQSCFYTLAESVSEVYTFALFKEDRILVVGSADVELLVFELIWLDGQTIAESSDPTEPSPKIGAAGDLTGAEYVEDQNSQANTFLRCKKRGALLRQTKKRTRQLALSGDESLICCLGSDSLVDVFRVYSGEESQKRFEKKYRKAKRKHNEIGTTDTSDSIKGEIAKDITLLISRVGGYTAESKVKWIDFCRHVKTSPEGEKEYRIFALLADNDVHGISLKMVKSNEVAGNSIVTLGRRGHRSRISTLSFASNGSCFLSGAAESAILWDFNTLLPKNTFTDETAQNITASLFTPNDREIVVGTKAGNICIFDLAECEMIECQKIAHDAAISALVALPKKVKNGFISVGHDKRAKFWNYQLMSDFDHKRLSIKLDQILELPEEVLCAAASPNGKFVAFGLLDNTARVYYADSLKFFVSLYGHSLPIYCIDISPDSKLVITGSGDKTVKIWGLDFGDCHKSIFAHDDVVSCVKFGAEIEEERTFWSAGRDGRLRQWDAAKFNRIQGLYGHSRDVTAMASTADGRVIITASIDSSVRLWKLTDEIINLKEEREAEREKEYEQNLLDAEDIVPGEALDKETDLAAIKTMDTIKSTEQILECVDILRNELMARESDKERQLPHFLLKSYRDDQLEFFIADALRKIRASHLEKALLMVPLSYIVDILKCLCKCTKANYHVELCCRVVLFLIRIHHNQIVNSLELLPIMEELKATLPEKVSAKLDQIGFNLAVLRFCQMHLEERNKTKLFCDVSAVEKKKRTKKKNKKVKEVAIVKV